MTRDDIDELWRSMAMIYGHRWTSGFGDSDDGTWFTALKRLPPEALRHGITQCFAKRFSWPPSLVEFIDLCCDVPTLNEFMAEYPSGYMTYAEIERYGPREYEQHARKLLETNIRQWQMEARDGCAQIDGRPSEDAASQQDRNSRTMANAAAALVAKVPKS